ncbi:protein argonaute-2-like [Papilio machaon]|uniref:protein argonaute-2-like n=1 Tax=Papilio machaon TaxID=76193 RepID=UPI001E66348A|nr:protein argonaute-2-like [Papilio machaon]XP_045534449.1 protein argonaute-2-like [Papilio machaon]
MGKGGKKKGQKKEEAQESTSSAAPQTDEPIPSGSEAQVSEPLTAAEPKTIEAPKGTAEVMEEEVEGLGLDLGGKKRKPRKKKSAAQAPAAPAETASAQTTPSEIRVTELVQPIAEITEQMIQQPGPSGEGSGRGRGRGHGRGRGQGRPQQQAGTFPPQPLPSSGGGQESGQIAQSSGQWNRPQPMPTAPSTPMSPSVGQTFGAPGQAPQPKYTPVSTVSQSTFGKRDLPTDKQAVTHVSQYKIPDAIRGVTVPSRAIRLLTNYLPMSIKFIKVHRYDVSFKPDKPKKMIPQAFLKAKSLHFKNHVIAFDQMKNCYSIQPLTGVTQTERYAINVELTDNNGKSMNFEVSFKYTGLVDLNRLGQHMMNGGSSLNPPTEAIQCIDVILRQGTLEAYVKAGKQFFRRPRNPVDLGYGLEMWTGLFQSAIFTSKPYINIDVAHKGFPKHQSMIQAFTNDFRLDPNRSLEQQRNPRSVELFHEYVKGLRVTAVIGADTSVKGQRREFICNRVVDPPGRLQFTMTHPDGRQEKVSVLEYFRRDKKYRLKYPELNCLWVGPANKSLYFPMELLEIVYGQPLKKQLNDMQLSKMVQEAATPPNIRMNKIEEVIKDMNYSANPFFKHFGLQISDKFLEVEAKVLQPPRLLVGDRKSVDPRRGVWNATTVLQPSALRSWGFVAIECNPTQCNYQNIIQMVLRVGNQMGMHVEQPKCMHFNIRMSDLANVLFNALEKDINFLFVIVSKSGRDYYHRVKRFAELEVGILTQCIKEDTAVRRMNDQTVRNILLKVNSKLMGINQALDGRCMPSCLRGPVMVVGADVTHPSPDQSNIPSIAAVTASIDPKCFLYNIELSVQTPKKEIIVEFEDMMVDHLIVYRKHNQNMLPKKIYVFRDGVSEGQFEEVMNSELTAVYRAYRRMTGQPEKPEVLFLLVQKRHHTRFFSGAQNPQNVEPGTVVDKQIVHAKELDFYLVSHQAIKGTARPTRYHAVCNDGGIPIDEVEQLTYYLCHLYARCMRAVSYPTPTYYAHLACLRAKSLTHGDKFDNEALERNPKRLHVLKKMLDFSRMFFV